jgi:nucleoid DNA-binding protein
MAKKKTKQSATGTPRTKSEVISALAEANDMSRKDVTAFFDSMGKMIKKDLGRSGPGMFNVPGMMKIKVVRKPATKARKGINPFTKEEMMFKAKPARNVVKVLPLKSLKAMV